MHQTDSPPTAPRNVRLQRAFGPRETLIHEFGISRTYRWIAAVAYSALMMVAGTMLYVSVEVLANSRALSDGGSMLITLHLAPLLAAGAITVIAVIAVWVYFLWYLRVAHAYALTDQRVIIHVGWLSAKYISINYEEMTDVKVTVSILERFLFGTGTLSINTAGADEFEAVVRHIDNPYAIKRDIFAMIQKA